MQTSTRIVRMSFSPGMTLESLPHQLNHVGAIALLVVFGRAPLCLRCRSTGQVRKNCRVSKCDGCHNFGHKKEECARTYATATVGATPRTVLSKHVMDKVEAEATSGTTRCQVDEEVRSPPESAVFSEPTREGSNDPSMTNDTVRAEAAASSWILRRQPSSPRK